MKSSHHELCIQGGGWSQACGITGAQKNSLDWGEEVFESFSHQEKLHCRAQLKDSDRSWLHYNPIFWEHFPRKHQMSERIWYLSPVPTAAPFPCQEP